MGSKVNLNTSDVKSLASVPGLNPELAKGIIEYRDKVGQFNSVGELMNVAGISQAIIDRFRDHVTIVEAKTKELPQMQVQVLLTGSKGSYAGHRLSAIFNSRETLAGAEGKSTTLWVPRQVVVDLTRDDDRAVLSLPNRADLSDQIVFRVHAPDGEVLYTQSLPVNQLQEKLEFPVKAREYAVVKPSEDPNFGKPSRLRGRVIDEAGRKQVGQRQVVIWGAQKAEPVDADFRALIVAQTDDAGFFTGPYPAGRFTAAYGSVAVCDRPVPVPIHLGKDGSFPDSVVLVADLGDTMLAEEDDCRCGAKAGDVPRDPDMADLTRADGTYSSDPGAGRCVDFTKPDRTLEEYQYSYVVRTTEPVIKGLTLQEPEKIDIRQVMNLISHKKAATTRSATGDAQAEAMMMIDYSSAGVLSTDRIDANILQKILAQDPDGFSLTQIVKAADLTLRADILRLIAKYLLRQPGRGRMSCQNPVDWDDEPTIYQACTIAHGHVLRFKQEWVADGYSMGNLLYSLPLAPGQKKQIAVVDWERRESASRTERLEEREELDALISRDRDINEIVAATVSESVRGGSKSSTGSFGGGLGIGAIIPPVGGLLGIGGGKANASSSAWQNSSRSTAASALNQLRDRTIQSASAVRSQRSTVVHTVRQGERVVATTETVANYNHCHAITIQYFEVLRHLLVRQRLVDVQECLFVPLLMSRFDSFKVLRWRHTLRPTVRSRRLRQGFDALERMRSNYQGSDFPTGSYADQLLEHMEGDLYIRFQLARPKDKDDDFDLNAWLWLDKLFPFISAADFYKSYLKDQQQKDRIFMEQLAPKIAERFVQHLQFFAVNQANVRQRLPVDTTLISNFVNDRGLYVSLRLSDALPVMARKDIKYIEINDLSGILNIPMFQILPAGSKVIVESGNMRYRTKYSSDYLFRDYRIQNDLGGSDKVRIFTPLSRQELRNPRGEDQEVARQLLDHLNEHIEHYHHAIWWNMSPDRRYMLLDGFVAPNSSGRSVASVVENELIGIVGNCMIMPVARGFHLDPTFRQDLENPVDLLEHYQPNTPIEPMRLAVPTRGVYAEAVMGACNSCEFKEEERFWRWEESPIPDAPPSILPVSTESRRAEPPDLTAKDFPAPMINLQNAPQAPDPTGLAAALNLLGTPNLFKDITGLEGTQRNALAALQGALNTAQFFGGKAADLALQGKMARDIDKAMRTIQAAKEKGLVTQEQAQELTTGAIRSMIGAGPNQSSGNLTEQPEVRKLLEERTDGKPGSSSVSLERQSDGQTEAVKVERTTTSPLAALFGAGSKPGTIGRRSTKAEALAKLTQARASTATSPWKLDRTKLLDRLEALVNDPVLVDQDNLNLCGPAAFARIWLARDPLAVVNFASELYDTGKSAINNYSVAPSGDSLLATDYAALKLLHPDLAPEADWMILGVLRDAANFWFDFEGKPEETAAAATTPGDVARWMEATNLYSNVKNEGNFVLTRSVSHALGLKPDPSCDIVLLVNAHMLSQMNITKGTKKSDDFILSMFPNHFIVLCSEITEAADDRLQFDYWTWGQQYSGSIAKTVFRSNYYGAVIGQGASV